MDKCVSKGLMHVTACYRRTPRPEFNKFGENKCRMPRPITVWDVHCQKLLNHGGKEKLVQSWPKSLKTCYGPVPIIMPNFIMLGQTVCEKRVSKIFYSWIVGQSSPILTASPYLSMCQTSFHSNNLCTSYLLPKFIDFVYSVTNKYTKIQTVNNKSLQQ